MRSKFKGKYLEIEPIGNSADLPYLLLIIWRDESIPPCRRVSDTSRHRYVVPAPSSTGTYILASTVAFHRVADPHSFHPDPDPAF
jgi:hypothetical protein